ncbi:ubiquitin carboxyl-terminal hydrolase, partial [Acanthamoeba castellanii str. Neff]
PSPPPAPGEVGKGLENKEGQNNCFLNVAIQSLWHLLPFTSRFANCEHHQHREHCVFCALKVILTNFEFSEEAVLPPQVLRITLDSLYRAEGKFKLGEIEDAAETLEAILENLHECIAADQQAPPGHLEQTNKDADVDKGCQPPCVAHQAFGIDVLEQISCPRCQEDSEPLVSSSWLYYVYSSSIRKLRESHSSMSFGEILHTIADQDRRTCPNERCKQEACPVKRDAPSPAVIVDVLSSISTTLVLDRVFNGGASPRRYRLKGMICYYGKHYDAYFYNPQRGRWVVFDDATVKEVGPSFDDVINKCRLGHFQPSILFYEGAAIEEKKKPAAESAPKPAMTLDQPLVDLNFDEPNKEGGNTAPVQRKAADNNHARPIPITNSKPDPDPEYKQTKRYLKDCLVDVITLIEMVSSPPLQVDLEILLVTATSLLGNINEIVDAFERRRASQEQKHGSDWAYSLTEVDDAAVSARRRLGELTHHTTDLKLQRGRLIDRMKHYEAAVKSAQKHRVGMQAAQMMEADLVLSVLSGLKNTLEAITLLHHADRQRAKATKPSPSPPSPSPTLHFAQPTSSSLAAASFTPPVYFIPPSPAPLLASPSAVSPPHHGPYYGGTPLAPSASPPEVVLLPSQIARGRTARAVRPVYTTTPPTRPLGGPRYQWNSYTRDWSPIEDLSDFLRFDSP